jgi:hypothetical protein
MLQRQMSLIFKYRSCKKLDFVEFLKLAFIKKIISRNNKETCFKTAKAKVFLINLCELLSKEEKD